MAIRIDFTKIGLMVLLAIIVCLPARVYAFGELEISKKIEAEQSFDPDLVIDRPRVQYSEASSRDPFRDMNVQVQSPTSGVTQTDQVVLPEMEVQGVIWGTRKPQAIINKKVLYEGDYVDDVLIQKISKTGIDVLYKNRVFVVPAPAHGKTDAQDPKGGSL